MSETDWVDPNAEWETRTLCQGCWDAEIGGDILPLRPDLREVKTCGTCGVETVSGIFLSKPVSQWKSEAFRDA